MCAYLLYRATRIDPAEYCDGDELDDSEYCAQHTIDEFDLADRIRDIEGDR